MACDPEHLFGAVKQYDLEIHPRELQTRNASATANIERTARCVVGQKASYVFPRQLGTQPARRGL